MLSEQQQQAPWLRYFQRRDVVDAELAHDIISRQRGPGSEYEKMRILIDKGDTGHGTCLAWRGRRVMIQRCWTNQGSEAGGRKVTYVYEDEQVSVPLWVVDLTSFRRWADSEEFPENGRIWWLKGEVWVDMSKQQILSHLAVKNEYNMIIGGMGRMWTLTRPECRGRMQSSAFFPQRRLPLSAVID